MGLEPVPPVLPPLPLPLPPDCEPLELEFEEVDGPVVPAEAAFTFGRCGLNGSFDLNMLSLEPPTVVSLVATTTGLASVAGEDVDGVGAELLELELDSGDFLSSTGTATSAATSTRATGQSRRLRSSFQVSTKNLFIGSRSCCWSKVLSGWASAASSPPRSLRSARPVGRSRSRLRWRPRSSA